MECLTDVWLWEWIFLPIQALFSWAPLLKFLSLSNFYPDPGCAGSVPIWRKTCRQNAVWSAQPGAALMGKFDVKGNSLLHFIFSSRSDVLPFPGAGYSKHSHAWSICPQIYINLNGYVQATSRKKSIQHPFFSCSTCNSVFPFLFTCHTSWVCSVTASSVSTFYSCKWMITLPSHLRRTSSARPCCPYTENSAVKLFLNIFS